MADKEVVFLRELELLEGHHRHHWPLSVPNTTSELRGYLNCSFHSGDVKGTDEEARRETLTDAIRILNTPRYLSCESTPLSDMRALASLDCVYVISR